MPKIAIIGGGPKAAAIVAKAYALRKTGYDAPDIVIYERNGIAASWSGQAGYTDGVQPLCSAAERDLGYPYDRAPWGRETARFMYQRFSWQAFLVSDALPRGLAYDDWVMHGRLPEAHREFAKYLQTAAQLAGATIVPHAVSELDHDQNSNQWRVGYIDTGGVTQNSDYDGIVITGTGVPWRDLPNANARVFNGQSFWQQLPNVIALLSSDLDPEVLIIGAGGTAGAIAHWFIRTGLQSIPVMIVGREPTLFPRTANFFEDRLFTDEVAWRDLADHAKEVFASRATRSVVWDYVLRRLETGNISYRSYDVRQFVTGGPSTAGPPALQAELYPSPDPTETIEAEFYQRHGLTPPAKPVPQPIYYPATVFIDARGFNTWWFVDDLLSGSGLHGHFAPGNRPSIYSNITFSLSVGGPLSTGQQFPAGLHVPMLASREGPGAANLMTLGWMSDRILRPYVSPLRRQISMSAVGILTD